MSVFSGSPGGPVGISCTRIFLSSLVAAVYLSGASAAPSKSGSKVCQSQKCRDLANEYLSGMDTTVHPCDDFYKYACGNWAKNHPLPEYSPRLSNLDIITNTTNYRLKEILEDESIGAESAAVEKAKQLYRACMDEELIENTGTTMIHSFLEANGGWPIITSSWVGRGARVPWQSIDTYYNTLLGESPLFSISVTTDLNDSSKNVLAITPPAAPNPMPVPISADKDAFFDNLEMVNYKNYIMDIVKAMVKTSGSIDSEEQLEKDVKGIIRFEANLHFISAIPKSLKSSTQDVAKLLKTTTIRDFQAHYQSAEPQTRKAQIDWLQRIAELFAVLDHIFIDETERIVVANDKYFTNLVGLLDRTSERDIVNWIHWWFVQQTIRLSNRELTQITENWRKRNQPAGGSKTESQPRWRRCVAENELKHALSYVYVQKYFSKDAKNTALEMIRYIENEMNKQITEAAWLDEEAKDAAREKIANMAKFIGYPNWYHNVSALDERYLELPVGDFYVQNVLTVKQFALRHELESLRKPVDKTTWITSPVVSNAFYSPNGNSLTFPAGILQEPFFDDAYPVFVNYGGIGAVIGHEISHGFDNVGSQFDKNGNARQWWSDGTREEYTNRTKCFVDQFNGFKLEINNVTHEDLGYHTLGENIADSTGMRAVFEAFKANLKQSGKREAKLPGLESFTSEQLFFLAYAGSLCENVKPEFLATLVTRDTHSTGPFRVAGTLANTEGFAKAFQCSKGTPMNPSNKCGIWSR